MTSCTAEVWVRSAGSTMVWIEKSFSRADDRDSRTSLLRATSTRFTPDCARMSANSRPIPSDAPVTSAQLPYVLLIASSRVIGNPHSIRYTTSLCKVDLITFSIQLQALFFVVLY